jgi:hypothetical protein
MAPSEPTVLSLIPFLGRTGVDQDLRQFSEPDGATAIKHIQLAILATDSLLHRQDGLQGCYCRTQVSELCISSPFPLMPAILDDPFLVAIGGTRLVLLKQQVIGLLASYCDDGLLISGKM